MKWDAESSKSSLGAIDREAMREVRKLTRPLKSENAAGRILQQKESCLFQTPSSFFTKNNNV